MSLPSPAMPFGKYKGKPIDKIVDAGYLEWLVEKEGIARWIKRAAMQQLGRYDEEDERATYKLDSLFKDIMAVLDKHKTIPAGSKIVRDAIRNIFEEP